MTDYVRTIQQLNKIRRELEEQLKSIKSAAMISYNSWDSDTRDAYQSAINSITGELRAIAVEIDRLKGYVHEEVQLYEI